ncbi:MAG: MFS transporter [Propionibacteriaceae bacterium]|jgi:NNP family nitrate/nitrite transporter-like MFS transporter|nr:MFS transporter [Propionibacteriaceae bacterium]
MSAIGSTEVARRDVLTDWNPEDTERWRPRQAWLTLWVTTISLFLGFMVWYLVSVIAPMLQNAAVVTKSEAFWLTSMTGLAGGLLRMVWMFLPPILGTKKMVGWSTVALIVPIVGWLVLLLQPLDFLAESFPLMMLMAFLTGIGGGIFSGYMPSTSYFFPKARQGVALGVQAGVGNFGVSAVQLITPVLVGVGIFGAGRTIPKARTNADGLTFLQTPAALILALLVVSAVLAFTLLKSVPIKANFRQQIDIFGNKHTWLMTLIYLLTFGCFSGLAGTFALMLNNMVPHVPTIGWLGGTTIAFLGAFLGSAARVFWGPLCDRFGGGVWTLVASIGMAISAVLVIVALSQTTLIASAPADQVAQCQVPLPLFLTGMMLLFFFAGIGNASTFKQMPMIFPPRQAGGVIGWTAAIAAFGPFIFSMSMHQLSGSGGNFGQRIIPIFVVVLVLALVCAAIDWWFYARPKAEAKS